MATKEEILEMFPEKEKELLDKNGELTFAGELAAKFINSLKKITELENEVACRDQHFFEMCDTCISGGSEDSDIGDSHA